MAISNKEKMLVGVMLIAAGLVGVGFLLVLPEYDTLMMNIGQQGQMDTEVKQLSEMLTAKKQELENFKKGKSLPPGLKIREFTPETKEKEIKEMLSLLTGFASTSGNTLISLEPKKADPNGAMTPPPPPPLPAVPNPAAPETTTTAGTAASGTTTPPLPGADPNAPPAAVVAPPRQEPEGFEYTLAIRGNFNSIREFLSQLNQYEELVEIETLELKNEIHPDRKDDKKRDPNSIGENPGEVEDKPHYDPTKPLRLNTNIKLYLVPKSAGSF